MNIVDLSNKINNINADIQPIELSLDMLDSGVPPIELDTGNLFVNQIAYKIYSDTTANWNRQQSLVGNKGSIYIYTDYQTITDDVGNTKFIPGLKVGDGDAYLIDIPFVSDKMYQVITNHIDDSNVHVTQQEREFWNNKVSAKIDGHDAEKLLLYTSVVSPD